MTLGLGGWGAGGNVRTTGLESHIRREALLQKLLFIFIGGFLVILPHRKLIDGPPPPRKKIHD